MAIPALNLPYTGRPVKAEKKNQLF